MCCHFVCVCSRPLSLTKAPSSAPRNQVPMPDYRHSSRVLTVHACTSLLLLSYSFPFSFSPSPYTQTHTHTRAHTHTHTSHTHTHPFYPLSLGLWLFLLFSGPLFLSHSAKKHLSLSFNIEDTSKAWCAHRNGVAYYTMILEIRRIRHLAFLRHKNRKET